MAFRKGFKEFLQEAHGSDVPVVILSAGVSHTIELFLQYHNALSPNIHIASNALKFDEKGICVGIECDNIIHVTNKDEHDMAPSVQAAVAGKTDVLLLGDSLGDIKMVGATEREKALKIGFLGEKKKDSREHFREAFDIVIESNDETFDVPSEILRAITGR